ncbi:MAG: FAD-dependent oxidoreductase [Thermoprotei archaeon]
MNDSTAKEVLVIGAGVLGVCTAYWMSAVYGFRVVIVDRELSPASHSTLRNTGVVHRPFHLDPSKKKVYASAAQNSLNLWKSFARTYGLPWKETGTIELATNDRDVSVLEKYLKWATQNGMDESELELLDRQGVSSLEPLVRCNAGLHVKTEPVTEFSTLTRTLLFRVCEANGVRFLSGRVTEITSSNKGVTVTMETDSRKITFQFAYAFNCAGGGALELAEISGVAPQYAQLFFRGEYWRVNPFLGEKVKRNLYQVPSHTEYPFLDPHLIVRADGSRLVGPNAVPVLDPYAYSLPVKLRGGSGALKQAARSSALSLLRDPRFLTLCATEWRSSLFKSSMCGRVTKFIPELKPQLLESRAAPGIRSMLIDRTGFLPEAKVIARENIFHVLNYNSPGATGAPAFSAYLVRTLSDRGYFSTYAKGGAKDPLHWDFYAISDASPALSLN